MKPTQEYQQGHATGYSKGYRAGMIKGLGISKGILLSHRETLINRLPEITSEVEAMTHEKRAEYWNRFFKIGETPDKLD